MSSFKVFFWYIHIPQIVDMAAEMIAVAVKVSRVGAVNKGVKKTVLVMHMESRFADIWSRMGAVRDLYSSYSQAAAIPMKNPYTPWGRFPW